MSQRPVPSVLALVGPTAAGKSALGLRLAADLGGEIINADAFALYRGMDIGTAKATRAEQAAVPHHCLDLWDVAEPASVAAYQQAARTAIRSVIDRGRVPIVVGGSMLYARAVCDEMIIPPHDPAVRSQLQAEADAGNSAQLYARLTALDPQAAAHIDPRNVRRVVRALEVVLLTGRFVAQLPRVPQPWLATRWLRPDRPRPDIDARIQSRTEAMWRDGLLDEVAALLPLGLRDSPTARKAVGYPQAMAHLAGEVSAPEAIAATVRATVTLARRQERAFRSDARVTPVSDSDAVTADWVHRELLRAAEEFRAQQGAEHRAR